MALPHPDTDWNYMLPEALDCFRRMIQAISRYATVVLLTPFPEDAAALTSDLDNVIVRQVPTNDTWTRDYGPITVAFHDGSFKCLDFTFNGWGMKFAACRDNRVNRRLDGESFYSQPLELHKDFVLEGGSIDSDGRGHLLVTSECLLEPNRNPMFSKQEIESRLSQWFGLRKVLWLDHGYLAGDDTDSHIDTLARFAPNHTIVCVGCDDAHDEHYQQLQLMHQQLLSLTDADGEPFTIVTLPMADPIYDDDGVTRLPATYANFLALNNVVVMPTYGSPAKDSLAASLLERLYGCPVVKVDCRALVKQHGSLHCSTMQIPLSALNL